MELGKSKVINHCGVNIQLFKYKIKDETYCILTSITEKISISEIKGLYWLRWKIETHNKKIKYDTLCNNIQSKNYNSFMTDIECSKFILTLSAFIEYIQQKYISSNKKINSKYCLHMLFRDLLSIIFYRYKTYSSEVARLLGIVLKTLVDIVCDRAYKRTRKIPPNKWCRHKNKIDTG
jgi:hypothetical protein